LSNSDFSSNIIQTQFIADFKSNIPSTKWEIVTAKNHVHVFAPPFPRLSMQESDGAENVYCFRFERACGSGS